jgi:hypothetical protein
LPAGFFFIAISLSPLAFVPGARAAHGEPLGVPGVGEGHGTGLDVERARMLSREGKSASEILDDAYARAR